jgi:hypothetical protein
METTWGLANPKRAADGAFITDSADDKRKNNLMDEICGA